MGRRRHRWPKRKPSAKGPQVVGWVVVTLGMGDPLPSVIERLIRRTGASISGSGWTWTCRRVEGRRGRWETVPEHRCWWRVVGSDAQLRAAERAVERRMGGRDRGC